MSMSVFLDLIIKPFIILSAFFCSILKVCKDKSVHPCLRLAVHLVYAAIISIIFGGGLSIYFIVGIAALAHLETITAIPIMLCFICIIFLFLVSNVMLSRDKEHNLPEELLNSSIVLMSYFKSKQIIKTAVFFGIFSFIAMMISTVVAVCFMVSVELLPFVLGISGIISLVICFAMYYGKCSNTSLHNAARMFSLWLLFSITTTAISVYRIKISVKQGWNNDTLLTLIPIGLTLASAYKFIPDSWRSLYSQFCTSHAETIQKMWSGLESSYSFRVLLDRIDNIRRDLSNNVDETKKLWHGGQKSRVIKAFFFSVSCMIIMFTILFNQNYIGKYLNNLIAWLWGHLVYLVGNEEIATMLIWIVVLLVWLAWTVITLARKYRVYSRNQKLILIGRIVFIVVMLIPATCIVMKAEMNRFLTYTMGVLFLALGVLSFFMDKQKKKKNNIPFSNVYSDTE